MNHNPSVVTAMQDNFEYYLKNKEMLLRKYAGKFLLISGQKVVKAFNNEFDAVEYAQKHYEPETFIIQEACEDADTQAFHSRVIFA